MLSALINLRQDESRFFISFWLHRDGDDGAPCTGARWAQHVHNAFAIRTPPPNFSISFIVSFCAASRLAASFSSPTPVEFFLRWAFLLPFFSFLAKEFSAIECWGKKSSLRDADKNEMLLSWLSGTRRKFLFEIILKMRMFWHREGWDVL